MKPYYNEGLLPDEYVEEVFKRLLTIKKGTVGEAFLKVAKEMSLEYRENYYDYVYELEGFINEVKLMWWSSLVLLCTMKPQRQVFLGCPFLNYRKKPARIAFGKSFLVRSN